MSDESDLLARIASALERIAPPPAEDNDWNSAPAFVWSAHGAQTVAEIDALPLEVLRGVDEQRSTILANCQRLADGAEAHDMLLWGARGMGKSALIRASIAAIQNHDEDSIMLVQIAPGELAALPDLVSSLTGQSRPALIFIDDLGFDPQDRAGNLALRSMLDGGVVPRPAHIRIAVTANRRAIVKRDNGENEALHTRDERDDALALADRFGLTLGFHPCDRETYLDILRAYTNPLGLEVNEEEALAWAIARGNRSGRSAYQFAAELAGRAGKRLN